MKHFLRTKHAAGWYGLCLVNVSESERAYDNGFVLLTRALDGIYEGLMLYNVI
jgi:hypothetical protein